MSSSTPLGWWRLALLALVVVALLLAAVAPGWRRAARPSVIRPERLAADVGAWVGQEVTVTGEWAQTAPSGDGLKVILLGRDGARVVCYFEELPAGGRAELDARLHRRDEVAVRGRCAGEEDGLAVLRGCCLLD